ncbi:RNA-directed DNA polymerase, eukaryota [Tanacetum coccineum]
MGSQRLSNNTKEDQTQRISKSVFVTNFLDHFTARDLWNVCLAYGNVIDVYIPFKKSKSGNKFAFVRFIRMDNFDRLIANLCTIWIGRFHLHANAVRFQRESKSNASQPNSAHPKSFTLKGAVNNSFDDFLKSSNTNPNSPIVSSPAIVLDDSCIVERDFSSSLMGKINDINAMSNLYRILVNEGFKYVKLSYLGGMWVLMETDSIESKENPQSCGCEIMGEIYWIRIKELEAWSPDFDVDQEDNSSSDEEFENDFELHKSDNFVFDNEEEIDHVSDSCCMHDKAKPSNSKASVDPNKSEDPFEIYKILNKKKEPEFNSEKISQSKTILADNNGTASSIPVGNVSIPKFQASGSILDVMDELIKMNFMSLNIQGLGNKAKKRWIQELNTKHRINFVAIQETKMEKIDLFSIKALWSNFCFDYVLCPSIGTWVPTYTKLCVISVYAPQELSEKKILWDYIHHLINSWDGECVILGDFNEVRQEQERYGTVFNVHGANAFTNFITKSGLVDLPLEGYSFTWSHKSASKMSKLDRFLITEGLMSLFPSISALCLDRHLSDHLPIIMRELNTHYGPTPARLSNLDKTIDQGRGTNDTVNDRSNLLKELHDLNSFTSLDLAQKAKNCWVIEGDEKSKYFHGIINKKRSQMAIRGVLAKGEWVVEPAMVKKEFFNHFSNRFAAPVSPKISIQLQFPKCLYLDQNEALERTATFDEIKKAVWDCGTNKSLGPDGFSFEFFRRYWDIINQDVVAAVLLFFSTGSFPPGCNSSFIALIPKTQEAKLVKDFRPISLIGSMYKIIAKILANRLSLVISDLVSDVQSAFVSNRQILDGPFILNELFSWCKRKNTKAMIFKVDFEKAFDSVRWDFLDEVLHKFGFGDKWRGWIQGCLSSAMGSILVNGLYKSIRLDDSLSLSHLFYADDVVFVGKWDKLKFSTIVNVLKWFFLASGLKINIHKSKLMGIGIPQDVVASTASSIGCATLTSPFNYLGVKVGGNMSRLVSWDEVTAKISSRLSKWKLKTLSVGGRYTLIKYVLSSLPLYYFSIFKVPKGILNKMESFRRNFFNGVDIAERKMSLIGWKKILASKQNGGLGISSLFALNRALLFKWIWRFITNGSSLWSRVIKAIHGNKRAIDIIHNISRCSSWLDIIRNGEETSFWDEVWASDSPLKLMFPRLYSLELDKSCSVAVKILGDIISSIVLSNSNDHWIWRLDSAGYFSVKSARVYIDDFFLPKDDVSTRWIASVPIKVNIFAWKVCLDKLPTRLNLSIRGLDIPSILCPNCYVAVESAAHILFSCDMACELLRKVTRWWEVEFHNIHSYGEWLLWFKNLCYPKSLKDVFEGVCYVMWWVIWKYRNQVLFGNSLPRMDLLFDEISRLSYSWCSSRCKSLTIDWNVWIKNPSSLSL